MDFLLEALTNWLKEIDVYKRQTDNCQKFLQVVQDHLGRIGIKIKAQLS